jgi:hypothetical protein
METSNFPDGFTSLEVSAIRLNEIYRSLLTGGFTSDEALSLLAKMTKSDDQL